MTKKIKTTHVCNNNWKPWRDLPHELLDLISDNLSLTDYRTFGGVCRSWRLFYLESKQRFLSLHSPPLVFHIANKTACFYNLTSQNRYKIKLPRLDRNSVIGISGGYLIVQKLIPNTIWLINPVTGHQLHCFSRVRLPPGFENPKKVIFASIGSAQNFDFLVLILSKINKKLYCCISRENQWKEYNFAGKPWNIEDIIFFDGKIFALTNDSQIGILNVRCLEVKLLKLRCAPRLSLSSSVSLVVSNNQLLVADHFNISFLKVIELYRIDTSRMEWIRVDNLGGEALFLGDMISSRTINPRKWGGRSNCVYQISSRFCVYSVYSLDGEHLKSNLTVVKPTRKQSWYFLQQSNSINNVRDD